MVTWGTNTVATFTTGTPAAGTPSFGSSPPPSTTLPPLFGAPAPAPSYFGSAPATGGFGATSSFGAPAPGSSIFGGTPAPGGSMFGSSTLGASGGGLFGSTPAPSTGGLFGTSSGFGSPPAPSAFGTTNAFGSNLFGQQQQQPAQPQVPAQAALQAHIDASNRQEAEKIKAALTKLHSGYSGTAATLDPNATIDATRFVSVVYNDLTQEQRQLQWLHGMASGTTLPVAPPRPPQVPEKEWTLAVVKNPDPLSYMPIPLIGAESLAARVSWQQTRATQLAKDAAVIQSSHDTVQQLWAQGHRRLEQIQRAHTNHRKRLLQVMRKIELVRCMNQPLQADEVRVVKRLEALERHVREVQHLLAELEAPLKVAPRRSEPPREVLLPDKATLTTILKGHREEITHLTTILSKDIRDVNLIKGQLAPRGATEAARHLQLL